MKKIFALIVTRYRLLRGKNQSLSSSVYLAFGWTIFGEKFVTRRFPKKAKPICCFYATEWFDFWLFNSLQPLAAESQPAPITLKNKHRWRRTSRQ